MDKNYGYYILGGMLVGALFGLLRSAGGNPLVGLALGAVVGTFLGWFAAAYVMEQDKQKKKGR